MPVVDNIEPFARGDTILLPFLITAGDRIVNISGGTVTAEIRVAGELVASLASGSGITIEQRSPEPERHQVAHGLITIPSEITAALPYGAFTQLALTYTNGAGVRMHALPVLLQGIT